MQKESEIIDTYSQAQEAVKYIKTKTDLCPSIAFILGSGLGEYADELQDAVVIPYEDIPHFKKSTVSGHKGNLVIGKKEGKIIMGMQGRYHYYEGYSMQDVVFPIYVFKAMGVQTLLITNAAGGVNKMLLAGDLMIIKDHINLLGTNPLIGPHDSRWGGERFPDMSNLYNTETRRHIAETMTELGLGVKQGTYVATTGPSYETPAEIKMIGIMGGDAVGMSTVPEAIVANSLGMKVGGISCICNMAAGISPIPLTHKEVVETANHVKKDFKNLLDKLIPKI
ncbi:hypothetical protein PPERSA_12566 [Pseudocohnilembus persalinus]|uniref:Purine nucleoside phosphorylase n=1 Tax=Pseudocohnilembus persalinus TaxID=266149 RepID=A0A0V0QCI3_PSEPJ|nr:hypothetical protein PPERSA_12566 [Pseudocohnilembus persalinus]|eukprot:KRW99890.1 hypothetical protein PPERSA_12566 [Pseudocohnilembus persalinus]